jgi:hypothetical protein
MKKFLFLAAALLLAGCSSEIYKEVDEDTARNISGEIRYTKDVRTGLCFALVSSRSYASNYIVSISDVPCNEEVLALAK